MFASIASLLGLGPDHEDCPGQVHALPSVIGLLLVSTLPADLHLHLRRWRCHYLPDSDTCELERRRQVERAQPLLYWQRQEQE
jgi:hypothetical protein